MQKLWILRCLLLSVAVILCFHFFRGVRLSTKGRLREQLPSNCSIDKYGITKPLKIVYTEVLKNAQCEVEFCSRLEDNKKIIASYDFSKAKPYQQLLEPKGTLETIFKGPETSDIEIPVLVGGASSNHFQEGLKMLENLNKVVRPAYPTTKLFLFDLGLRPIEANKVLEICNCTLLPFPFEKFPPHVKELFGYCWKPLIIKMLLQRYRFVMWMDTSVRFKTSQLDPLFVLAKQLGVLSNNDGHRLPAHIHEDTFLFLHEPPCLFRSATEYQGTLLLFHSDNEVINDYVIYPWVSCALIEDCMKTKNNITKIIKCPSHKKYHSCHRFDQAILGLLLYRLFHDSYMKFHIDGKYYDAVRF